MVAVVCVARSGGRYDATWVDRLQRAARRHVPEMSRFVCLTDLDLELPDVEVVRFRHDWPRWWAKIEAFRADIATERTVLIDLDTLLLADATALARGTGVVAMEDFFHRDRVSTALMAFDAGALEHVYERFAADAERWMMPGSCGPVPNAVHGDQVVVDHFLREAGEPVRFLQREHPGLVEFHSPERTPSGPVLVFIGDSKPDAADEPVRSLWLSGGERAAA